MPAPGAGQVPQPMAGATPPAQGSRAPQAPVPAPSAPAQSTSRYGGQGVPAPTQGQVPQPTQGQVPQPMQGATPPARVPMGQQASPQFGQGARTRASAQFGAPSAPDQAPRAAGNPFAPPGQSASEPGTPQASSASRASAPGAPAPGQFTPGFRSFVRSGPSMPGPGTAQYPQAAPQAAQVWVMPEPERKPLPVFEGVTIGAGAAMMLLGILGAILVAGPLYGMFFAFMCLFPLSIVISFLLFVDRFEPEPWWTKIAAFLWGGGVAIFFAGMSNDFAKLVFSAATDNPAAGEVFAVVVGAPLGEEFLKALGVIAIVLLRRNNISSPLDGLLYGGLSAAGFLVVEDFGYFVDAAVDGTFWTTFFVRVFMGVFGHVMYTSLTGWAIGWAVTRTNSIGLGCGAITLGYLLGVTLHGVWNGSGYIVSSEEAWYLLYACLQIPLFIGWLCFVGFAMKRERRDAAAGLMPYVQQGWIIPSEVQMVCHPASRRTALNWAARGGPASKKAMKQFIYALATLGLDQVVMNVRGPEPKRLEATREATKEATEQRAIFMRLTGARVV